MAAEAAFKTPCKLEGTRRKSGEAVLGEDVGATLGSLVNLTS